MDPLSDVLSLMKPRGFKGGGIDAGGDICIGIPAHQGVFCYAVVAGECWIAVDGAPEAALLQTGDCVLLPRGRPFRLASDLTLPPVDVHTLVQGRPDGAVATHNGGGAGCVFGGHFALDGASSEVLLSLLPPLIHLREGVARATLRWCLDRMMQELRTPQPGGALVVEHLAHLMLVEALRLHLTDGLEGGSGWLFALADAQMRAALTALHADPPRRWSVQELAEHAGMSRTKFALRFKDVVGASPIDYLTRWRMLLAGDRLTSSADPISSIAYSLGYESEAAFSTAFKRVMGCPPRRYARGSQPPARVRAPRAA